MKTEKTEDVFFGIMTVHPPDNLIELDIDKEALDELHEAGKPTTFDAFDEISGLNVKAVPTITFEGETRIISRDELIRFIVEGQGILRSLDAVTKAADATWAEYRRRRRGEEKQKT